MPLNVLKIPHRLIMVKMVYLLFLGCHLSDPLILAGNENIDLSLDEFIFRPHLTTDYGVSCL